MSYFKTRGRLNRWRYFLHILPPSLISTVGLQMLETDKPELIIIGSLLSLFGAILIAFPAIQRLHDLDASGWWFALSIIPLANLVLGIVLLFVKGTEGENSYGSNPLQSNRAQGNDVSSRWDTEERISSAWEEKKPKPSGTQQFDPDQHEKKCPMCAEYIKLEARVCRYCGHGFSDEEVKRQIEKRRNEVKNERQNEKENPLEEKIYPYTTDDNEQNSSSDISKALMFILGITILFLLISLLSNGF